ncbi:hypothetical protein CAL28_13405 [Bordetella genomosp. 11]|uniref:NEL domain-containing protein n=2 Tax=Bordetella genomosp. 11 TaxID=1416808 RepID=A0A261UEQ8_9BORD|nr:hypothetical protein CAL28_13405 [Bordetella genomosp. 11]
MRAGGYESGQINFGRTSMRRITLEPTAYPSFASYATGGSVEPASGRLPAHASGETGRLVNFANVIDIVVVGHPTEQELGQLEHHIRGLYCLQTCGSLLRDLCRLTEQHGSYPVIVFRERSRDQPVTLERGRTARPGERIDPHAEPGASPSGRPDENPEIIGLIASLADELLRVQQAQKTNAELLDILLSRGHLGLATDEETPRMSSTCGPSRSSSPLPLQTSPSVHPGEDGSIYGPIDRSMPDMANRDIEMPDLETLGTALSALRARQDRQKQATAHHSWQTALMPWLGTDAITVADEWLTIERAARNERDREGIGAFKDFLVLLAVTDAQRHGAQRIEVANWLRRAALPASAQLRADAFEACFEAAGSCQDGALSTWNKLSMLAIEADVREGRYQGRLADLHGVALSIFRMNELEKIAGAKVEQLYAQEQRRAEAERQLPEEDQLGADDIVDPLETYLGYQVGLREALNLPIPVTRMIFSDMALITAEDIDQALEAIGQAEKERFPAWLLLDFGPFLNEVRQQLGPDASAKITDAAITLYEATAKYRVPDRLHALGLPDNDIERLKMSARLSREIQYAAWLPHANKALADAGLPALPQLDDDEKRRTALMPADALMV